MSEVFTFSKLYQAYLDCRKNKRKTTNALKFEWDLERNLFQLEKELQTKNYRPGSSVCFVVKDPCPREIFAATFRDRIIHHLLVKEIEEMGERAFIFDSFACRKNKGTHLGIKRLRYFLRKITGNYRKEAYYLQLDISSFFMSIDHYILYSLFKKLILKQNKSFQWKENILWLGKTIIFHNPTKNYTVKGSSSFFSLIPDQKSLFFASPNKGLPIGNYSSQFFANLYLNELDQFVKRELNSKYYVRYVDDFILLNQDKKTLKLWKNKIEIFLKQTLKLRLNSKKEKTQPTKIGIDFLGYIVKTDYVLVLQRVVQRLKNKLAEFAKNKKDDLPLDKKLATINSYYGHFQHASGFKLRRSIYQNYLNNLGKNILTDINYSSIKIKKKT